MAGGGVSPALLCTALSLSLLLLCGHTDAQPNVWLSSNGRADEPHARFGAAYTALGYNLSSVLVHGGATFANSVRQGAPGLSVLSDSWSLGIDARIWLRLPTSGFPPPALAFHTLTFVDQGAGTNFSNGTLLVYGGTSTPFDLVAPKLSGVLWQVNRINSPVDGLSINWQPQHIAGVLRPSARAAHTSVIHRGFLVVYGGYTRQEGLHLMATPETWLFHLATSTWRLAATGGGLARAAFCGTILPAPSPRLVVLGGFSTATIVQYPFLFLPGNLSSEAPINRVASLDLDALIDTAVGASTAVVSWVYGEGLANFSVQPQPSSLVGASMLALGPDSAVVVGGYLDGLGVSELSITVNLNASDPTSRPTLGFQLGTANFPPRAFAVSATPDFTPPVIYGGLNLIGVENDLWIFDVNDGVWFPPFLIITPQTGLFGAGAVVGRSFYSYGGYKAGSLLSTLWRLNLDTHQWTSYHSSDPALLAPTGRTEHAIAYWEHHADPSLLMTGGISFYGKEAGQVWAYSLRSSLWRVLAPPNGTVVPVPKVQLSAVIMSDQLVLFGGLVETTTFRSHLGIANVHYTASNELWYFDLGTNTWSNRTVTTGPSPAARGSHAAVIVKLQSGTAMVVYAGSNAKVLFEDLWLFLPGAGRWVLIEEAAPAGQRCGFGAGAMGPAALLIHGGVARLNNQGLGGSPCAGATFATGTWALYVHDNLSVTWKEVDASVSYWSLGTSAVSGAEMTTLFGFRGAPKGALASASAPDGSLVSQINVRCRAGSSSGSFVDTPCTECPAGSYRSDLAALECTPCRDDTTTEGPGAVSLDECNLCAAGFCQHNGACSIIGNQEPRCECAFGFSGARCGRNEWAIGLGGTLLGLMAVSLVALIVWRTRRKATFYMKQTELQEKLLQDTEAQLELFDRVWSIDPTELRMISMVDSGAYGEVWRAEYADKPVAVKKMHAALVEVSHDVIDEFKAEIETLKVLRHSNIVFFYGGGVWDDGVPFLVTEYFERGSLRKVLEDESIELGFETQLGFARDTAHGMMFLHKFGHIHRDLKSGNLLISDNWRVKVADFGTARLCSCLADETSEQCGETRLDSKRIFQAQRALTSNTGTLLWSAPEVLRGDNYDQTADVYSYGVVVWEIVTRAMPWSHVPTTWAIREAVEAGERPAVPEDCPAVLASLMQESWHQDPQQRPSFKELAARLDAFDAPDAEAPSL